MKHLLLITTSYPLTGNGSEAAGSFVADFAGALASKIRVTVIAPAHKEYIEQPNNSLSVRYFAVPKLPLSSLKPHRPADWLAILNTLKAGGRNLRQVIENDTVDHIFALWALPSGYWARNIADAHGIPYSTWALGSDIWSLGQLPLVRNLLKHVLHDAHSNFADGYQLKEAVETLSGKSCEFLPSTRNLLLTENKQLSSAPPYRLAFLGRWHPNKGTDILLESLALLEEPDWRTIAEIRIAGGGPLENTVREAHAKLREDGRPVTLLGYLQKQASAELFAWADYVLIPSRIESIPVVFSDAMKCKCPVIVMPVGDLPRLLQEYTVGELAETVTAAAFAAALRRILQKKPAQFESELQQAAADFSVEHSVNMLMDSLVSSTGVTHE
jgi:glycosyltransferase involved in cell wall biosynthesis